MTEEVKKEVPKQARNAMKANVQAMFADPDMGGGKKVGIAIIKEDGRVESFVAFDSPEALQKHRQGLNIPDCAYVVAPGKDPIHVSNFDQLKTASVGIALAPDASKPVIPPRTAKPELPEEASTRTDEPLDTKAFADKELQYGSGFKHGTKDGKGKADAEEREATRQAQLALQKLGYDVGKGGADGRLGSDTMDALNKFEKENGIEPPSEKDGNKPINKNTLKKLAEKVKEKETAGKDKEEMKPEEKKPEEKKPEEKKPEEKKPEEKKPEEKKPEEKKADTDMITVKPKKDMTVDEMAIKLGVDKDRKNAFEHAMNDALGGRTKINGGEEVHVDAKQYGISPGDQHSAAAKGVDVKKSTGRT